MAYAAWLEANDYAYGTRYLEVTTVKKLVKFLVEEGHLPATASFKLSLRKPDETDTYCYTPEEVAAIVTRCRTVEELTWLHAVIMCLIHTGMRISELASLRWSDVDLDRKLIILSDERHSVARRKKGDARELKGKRSRSFPIHPHLSPVLQAIPHAQDSLVFHGRNGGRIKPDTVRRILIRDVLQPLAKRFPIRPGAATEFADGRVHSFRHFFLLGVC